MSANIKDQLRELLLISSAFNTNDVLVHCTDIDRRVFPYKGESSLNLNSFPKLILRDAQRAIRETGVNPLCLVQGIVELHVNGKDVRTPLFLIPVNYTVNKIKGVIEFDFDEEERIINPFLERFLVREHQLTLNQDALQEDFKSAGLHFNNAPSFLGNFHHHRFEIVRELEDLIATEEYSPALKSLFGESAQTDIKPQHLHPAGLFSSDCDQEKVYSMLEESNLAIQGPPGTGKSHVLTNLAAKLLYSNQRFVVVSEKFVALDVIRKKLAEFDLDKFSFIASGNNVNAEFKSALKKSWDWLENYQPVILNNMMLSEQYEAHLQIILDLLNVPDLVGGISFNEFYSLLENEVVAEAEYSSEVPDLNTFITERGIISNLYASGLAKSVAKLKGSTLRQKNFNELDGRLRDILSELYSIQSHLPFSTWGEFLGIMHEASRAQIFENDLYKEFFKIFNPESKDRKKFDNLYKKYTAAKRNLEALESETHWIKRPDQLESIDLLNSIKNTSWLGRFKLKKRWAEYSSLSIELANEALQKNLEYCAVLNSISQLEVKFCELGLSEPQKQVDIIHYSICHQSDDEWMAFIRLNPDQRLMLTEHHSQINVVYEFIKDVLTMNEQHLLIEEIEKLLADFGEIVSIHDQLSRLSVNSIKTLSRNDNFSGYYSQVIQSHHVRFKEQFPQLSGFNPGTIKSKIEDVIAAQFEESKIFASEIKQKLKTQFDHYHYILSTPARKLSDEEKALKSRLKKGKTILVKEFSKTRRFVSPRELYESDAKEWLELLIPVWLTNPSKLSNCFPMKPLFDYAIFDEASQIPLQNGLGAVQRSLKVVVAGDEQQMSPSSYFQSVGADVPDLLHQANYYYRHVSLKHHYRSEHPDLIAFSNKHFYNNELQVYPAFNSVEKPLTHIFLENGVFENRRNELEAKEMARLIAEHLKTGHSIGIVAFSEEQLSAIWSFLDNKSKQILEERISSGNGFFKSLENVQGDECDHLLISFAYGRNEAGDFNMRFGPMNTMNGRKRLNVLLTRAVKSITFITSIRSSDFKLSDNESIELLRQWFSFLESTSTNHITTFPFGLQPLIESNGIIFVNVQQTLANARELVTLHRALTNRNWEIQYR